MSRIVGRKDLTRAREAAVERLRWDAVRAVVERGLDGMPEAQARAEVRARRDAAEVAIAAAGDEAAIEAAGRVDWSSR